MAAPAASHATAVSTSSSSVVGSCGQSALAVSAPVGATVMRSGSVTAASCQKRPALRSGWVPSRSVKPYSRASTATSIVCPVNRIASGSAASATTARAP